MELTQWEMQELERLRKERATNLHDLYFETTEADARLDVLNRIKENEGDSELVRIYEELYNHRYVSREKNAQKIDYGMRGWINIKFLPEVARGWFSRKKLGDHVNVILSDLGKDICDKYGQKGREVWFKELCNTVRVYLKLCQSDKTYGSIIFGIGKIKPDKLMSKIGQDVVTLTYSIPKEIGMLQEFEQLAQAAKNVFSEYYPKHALFYEQLLDEADMKTRPLRK